MEIKYNTRSQLIQQQSLQSFSGNLVINTGDDNLFTGGETDNDTSSDIDLGEIEQQECCGFFSNIWNKIKYVFKPVISILIPVVGPLINMGLDALSEWDQNNNP